MVLVLGKDWESLKQHIESYPCEIVYRVDYIGSDRVRLRIKAGSLAFDHVLNEKDTLVDGIISFIENKNAIRISHQKDSNTFFM